MRYLLFLFIALFTEYACMAQASTATSFTIGIIVPDATSGYTAQESQRLESKLTQIINHSNEAVVGYNNDIVIYPVIDVIDSSVVSGGMQNIAVMTLEISLYIKQLGNNVVYNTITKKVKGSGDNSAQAKANAFGQLNVTDNSFAEFIRDAKMKILAYYNNNCQSLINTAMNMSAKQNYAPAIGMLQSIPFGTRCYNEAITKATEVYGKYQSGICSKVVSKAKGEIAVNNFDSAMATLQEIDPASNCYPEVDKLIAQISAKVAKQEKREEDREQRRLDAIKEIAKAYYSPKVKNTSYSRVRRS
ncbi:MAG: hypothetical protein H0X33_05665 [Taibaiella sp.]|nr:hypothetical protein [Taibaiella sp.]